MLLTETRVTPPSTRASTLFSPDPVIPRARVTPTVGMTLPPFYSPESHSFRLVIKGKFPVNSRSFTLSLLRYPRPNEHSQTYIYTTCLECVEQWPFTSFVSVHLGLSPCLSSQPRRLSSLCSRPGAYHPRAINNRPSCVHGVKYTYRVRMI